MLWPIVASLLALTRLMATEPADADLGAPAPEVAEASNVLAARLFILRPDGDRPGADGGAVADGTDGACLDEVECDGGTDADLGDAAGDTLKPSKWRWWVSGSTHGERVRLEVTVRPSGMVASASLSAMLTLTAAATLTLPSEVLAEGVDASPLESPAPTELASVLAKFRCAVF